MLGRGTPCAPSLMHPLRLERGVTDSTLTKRMGDGLGVRVWIMFQVFRSPQVAIMLYTECDNDCSKSKFNASKLRVGESFFDHLLSSARKPG
jgi:hypothetical protein